MLVKPVRIAKVTASRFASNPKLVPYALASRLSHSALVPDRYALQVQYHSRLGVSLDLNNPRTFNEKLQWLKLHDRNPLHTTLVDKLAVKQWVADRIGSQYVVPTYASWDNVAEIDWGILPDQFVIKTNHDSGGHAICKDKSTFDRAATKKKLSASLRRNYYWATREWPYKNVVPRVFAEQYLVSDTSLDGLCDYKFMCFGGKPRMVFTCTGRAQGDLRVDFFDLDWRHLPFTRHYPNADVTPSPPACLREMIGLAAKLSAGIPFVRVDFYEVGGRPLFGEMTFYPGAGFEEFDPPEWDLRLGEMIDLKGAFGAK